MARRGRRRPQDQRRLRIHGEALTVDPLAATALCRAIGDGAALLAFGGSLFAARVIPPDLRDEAGRRARRLVAVAAPLVALATLARLPLLAAALGEGWGDASDPTALATVLTQSAAGRAWAVQAAAALLLAVAAAWRRSLPASAACAGLVLASLVLSGHAAAATGAPGWIARLALALHLLAAGAWIGSLPEVLVLMRRLSRGRPAPAAALALRRFSAFGHAAVAVVLAGGTLATALVVGIGAALPVSSYGGVLAGKIALVLAMTALAVFNRYRLVPRLPADPAAAPAILAATRAVLGLGLAAVAASGWLGLLDPG